MATDTAGKELVQATFEEVVPRSKPHLIQVGNRYLSSDGRFHYSLAATYLLSNARSRMVAVGELAKVFYGANIPINKRRIRRRLPEVFKMLLLERRELLVIDADATTGRALAVKIYDPRSELDRQTIRPKLERMERRKELSNELFDQALKILALSEQAAEPEGSPTTPA